MEREQRQSFKENQNKTELKEKGLPNEERIRDNLYNIGRPI